MRDGFTERAALEYAESRALALPEDYDEEQPDPWGGDDHNETDEAVDMEMER